MEPRLKFNWGALMFAPIFGIANKAWLCLLSLVPGIGFIFSIVSGFCAPKWAYDSGEFQTVEEFNAVMKSWNRAGVASAIATGAFILLYFLFFGAIFAMIFSAANQIA